jgi:beta-lactamase class A
MVRLGETVNKLARRGKEPEEFLSRKSSQRKFSVRELETLRKRKEENRKWIFGLVLATAVLSLGFWAWGQKEGNWEGMISPIEKNMGEIADGKPATQKAQKDFEGTERRIEEAVKDLQGSYGVYAYNLTDKQEFGINQDEIFPAASLMKLPMILTLYQEAEAGKIDLESVYVLKTADKKTGAGVIQYKPEGAKYTYRELSQLMGRYSDNTAFNVVRQLLGDEKIQGTIDDLGMTKTSLGKDETSATDIGLFFRKFYAQSLLSRNHRDEILDYLTKTADEDWIPAGVPEGVRVTHKVGKETNSFSDAGIIFGKEPFVLVILSKEASEKEALKALPEITKIVWEFEGN